MPPCLSPFSHKVELISPVPFPPGGDGILYNWDMRTRRCMGQMVDCGNKDSASLSLSRDGRYLATGSASGVVNVYRQDQCWGAPAGGTKAGIQRPTTPAPLREVMNLTTTVDTMSFSPDGQILVGEGGIGWLKGRGSVESGWSVRFGVGGCSSIPQLASL